MILKKNFYKLLLIMFLMAFTLPPQVSPFAVQPTQQQVQQAYQQNLASSPQTQKVTTSGNALAQLNQINNQVVLGTNQVSPFAVPIPTNIIQQAYQQNLSSSPTLPQVTTIGNVQTQLAQTLPTYTPYVPPTPIDPLSSLLTYLGNGASSFIQGASSDIGQALGNVFSGLIIPLLILGAVLILKK